MTQIERIRAIIQNPFKRPNRKLLEIAEIVRRKRTPRSEGKTADPKAYHAARYRRLRAAGLCRDCEQPAEKSLCPACAQRRKMRTCR